VITFASLETTDELFGLTPGGLALLGLVVGIVLSTIAGWVTLWLTNRREDRLRFTGGRQQAYANLLGLFDRMAGDDPNDSKAKSIEAELVTAFAVVDLLAPPHICHLASDAHAYAWRALYDEKRVAAMEPLISEMRKDLGVKGAWKQQPGEAAATDAPSGPDTVPAPPT
jgi:hypothetical protein